MESSESEHSPERNAAATGSLHDGRQATVSAVGGAVPKVTVDRFFEHVLPPLHACLQGKVDDIWDNLVKNSCYDTVSQEWTAFQAVQGENENTTFSALVVVAKAIETAAQATVKPLPEQVLKFSNDPDRVPESIWRTTTNKPDGYFILCKPQCPAGLKAHWIDIGATGEYKLKNRTADVNDNLEKLLWNMSQSVKDDARRKFTFAFTIEGRDMRLWYGGRAEYVASDTFDFMKEPKRLVEFFLKFFYAPIELSGWDSTMQPIWEGPNNDQLQYVITVRSTKGSGQKTYKTVSLLSSIAAEALRGRGTRVWLAEPCDAAGRPSGGPQVVIKDCWIDQGLDREGNIIRMILKDAKKLMRSNRKQKADERISKSEYDLLAESLLTPEVDGDVFWTDEEGNKIYDRTLDRDKVYPDGTAYYYIFDKALNASTAKRLTQLQEELKGEHRSVWQQIGSHEELIEYNPKAHYRIVFSEVCRTVRDEELLEDIMIHLGNTCLALKVLHKVGWVHRDISAGNILLYEEHGIDIVKIADLEYAKSTKKAAGKKHDIRTGTLDFMAVEVYETSYMFLKVAKRLGQQASTGMQRLTKTPGARMHFPPMPKAPVPWAYNPIHDLESVWWLAAFFTLNKDVVFISESNGKKLEDGHALHMRTDDGGEQSIPAEDASSRATRIATQARIMRTLFHHSTKRQSTLRSGLAILGLRLHPALEAAEMMECLDSIRGGLVTKYEDAEAALSETSPLIGPVPDLCDSIMNALGGASRNLGRLSARVAISDLAREAALSRNVSRRQVTGGVERATSGFALMSIAETPDGPTNLDASNAATVAGSSSVEPTQAANTVAEVLSPPAGGPTPPDPVPGRPITQRRGRNPPQVPPSTRRLRSQDNVVPAAQPAPVAVVQQPPPPAVAAHPTTDGNTAEDRNDAEPILPVPGRSGPTAQRSTVQTAPGASRGGPSSASGAKSNKPAVPTRSAPRRNPPKAPQEESSQAAAHSRGHDTGNKGRGGGTRTVRRK